MRVVRLWAILLLVAPAAPAEELRQSTQQIVDRALDRAQAQYEAHRDAQFSARMISVERSLDSSYRVKSSEEYTYLVRPLEGAVYAELTSKDGRALSPSEQREERKRQEKFRREVKERIAKGLHPQPPNEVDVRFNRELMDRYRVALVGEETLRGHDCWVISFEPKSDNLPVKKRIDPALNSSFGKLWISQEDYGVARVAFAMSKPYKYWGGLLATIRDTEAELEFDRVAPGVWAPRGFDFRLDLEVLMLKSIRRHITKQWSEYRRAEAGSAPVEVGVLGGPG